MGKLIMLLNKAQNSANGLFGHWIGNFERKYCAKNHWTLTIDTLGYTDEDYEIHDYSDRDICGKDGGFIKRLVDNDKIDYEKSPGEIMIDDLMGTTFSLEDSIVMTLSISDNPIEDLISYLK